MSEQTQDFRTLKRGAFVAGVALVSAVVGFLGASRIDGGGGPPARIAGAEMQDMDMPGMDMGEPGVVRIGPAMVGTLGITLVEARLEPLTHTVRTTGTVTYDETRRSSVSPKIGGWVEALHVNFTGQTVRRGQALLEIYSPDLVSAQEELLAARRLELELAGSAAPGVAGRTAELADAARRRLLLWDITPEQLEALEETGEVRRTLTLHAPFDGFVLERNVEQGQTVVPGETLYRLADLSRVWIEVDVYERDLRFVQLGQSVDVRIDAYPGEAFAGTVSYIHPDLRADTRTARVRVVLANPGTRIKPGMFAAATLEVPVAERAVVVPRDAVMRTGPRNLVFVEQGPGSFDIREVGVGFEGGGVTQILSGLLAGERVVARGNFLLDAESRLMEAMMGQPGMAGMEMDTDMPGMEMDR